MSGSARAWPLWLLTAALLALFQILNYVYWPLALPDAQDSVALAIGFGAIVGLVAAPVALAVTGLCLRRPRALSVAGAATGVWRAAGLNVMFGALALLVVLLAVGVLLEAGTWLDRVWGLYALGWLPWVLGLRAAVVARRAV